MNTFSCLRTTITEVTHTILREIPKLNQQTLWIETKSLDSLSLFEELPFRSLGIVGSRVPQAKSRLLLERTCRTLQGSGIVIISGLARGIDAEAHRLALDMGLKTIGVLAHGFDYHYPEETMALRREIVDRGGLVISEYAPDQEPRPYQFIHRNRIIAALSRAVWVVQAGKHSGALNTAKWAQEFQREVFVTPCFPGDASLMGNEKLLQEPNIQPFWSTESLSSVWLDLFSRANRQPELFH